MYWLCSPESTLQASSCGSVPGLTMTRKTYSVNRPSIRSCLVRHYLKLLSAVLTMWEHHPLGGVLCMCSFPPFKVEEAFSCCRLQVIYGLYSVLRCCYHLQWLSHFWFLDPIPATSSRVITIIQDLYCAKICTGADSTVQFRRNQRALLARAYDLAFW